MKEILNKIGKEQRATLATRVYFETERAITKLERDRYLATVDQDIYFEAEIGICNSLNNWFQENLRGKDVVDNR